MILHFHIWRQFVQIILDTSTGHIHWNGKELKVDPMEAFFMAPEGTVITVTAKADAMVTLDVQLPEN